MTRPEQRPHDGTLSEPSLEVIAPDRSGGTSMSHPDSRLTLVHLVISALLMFSLLRLAATGIDASLRSLQMDYAAFYTAGEALNAGVSPYVNHLNRTPPIWDGVDEFQHSRFLYPPLFATLMQPLALLPYAVAKALWTALTAICILLATWLHACYFRLRTWQLLLVLGLIGLFHPLLEELERGQVDGLTFLLLTGSIITLTRPQWSSALIAGALLSVATLLKLHCAFVVPFLLLRKHWHATLGFVVTALLLVAASLLVNGPQQIRSYVLQELPRIARHGEGGDSTMRAQPDALEAAHAALPPDFTVKDGRMYVPELFPFRTNASFVRAIGQAAARAGIHRVNQSSISLVIITALIALLWLADQRRLRAVTQPATEHSVYWQLVQLAILMAAPLTWSMNLVWLLGTLVFAVAAVDRHLSNPGNRATSISLSFVIAGLALAAMPDDRSFPMWLPLISRLLAAKYLVAELMLFAGLIGYLRSESDAGVQGERNLATAGHSVARSQLGA